MANQTCLQPHKLCIAHWNLLIYARIACRYLTQQETNLFSIFNPAFIFYGVSVFFIFVIWLLWKLAKSTEGIDVSLKEIAKGAQKPQA